jgi:hypothetical protein
MKYTKDSNHHQTNHEENGDSSQKNISEQKHISQFVLANIKSPEKGPFFNCYFIDNIISFRGRLHPFLPWYRYFFIRGHMQNFKSLTY